MPKRVIECPSGMVVEVAGLKGRQANLMINRDPAKAAAFTDEVLEACFSRLEDPGPYGFDGGKVKWDKVLTGDRRFLIVKIRAVTFGPDFDFDFQCRDRQCRRKFPWTVSLDELEVHPLSDDAKERFSAGNRFESAVRVGGKTVTFRLLTGKLEYEYEKLERKAGADRALLNLVIRTVAIEGVTSPAIRFYEDQDMGELVDLREEMDEADCYIKTEVEVRCLHCGREETIEVPFADETPRRRRPRPAAEEREAAEPADLDDEDDEDASP